MLIEDVKKLKKFLFDPVSEEQQNNCNRCRLNYKDNVGCEPCEDVDLCLRYTPCEIGDDEKTMNVINDLIETIEYYKSGIL